MELITIIYTKSPIGFTRSQPQQFSGVRFPDGQIAYQDEAGEIRGAKNEAKLKEALPGAVVETAPGAETEHADGQP